MLDFNRIDERLLDGADVVVSELQRRVGIDPGQVMLVGAECRDVLHSALGHEVGLRLTDDTDIAIAMTDWRAYDDIATTFPRSGHTGVRYVVDAVHVDIMPFGDVEDPSGVVTPRQHGEGMIVFGFDDVFARSLPLTLPTGSTIRIPTIAGYTALKMRAWIDRSSYGQNKDGKDLAVALYWYSESEAVRDRLFDQEAGQALLDRLEWDQDLASANLLGADIRGQLSPQNRGDLVSRWAEVDRDYLSRSLELPAGLAWTGDRARRLALIDELLSGIASQ